MLDIIIPVIVLIMIVIFVYQYGVYIINAEPIPELIIIELPEELTPEEFKSKNLFATYKVAKYDEVKNQIELGAEIPTDSNIIVYKTINRPILFNDSPDRAKYIAVFDDRNKYPNALPWSSTYKSAYDQTLVEFQ
jgi:hypothetical protein